MSKIKPKTKLFFGALLVFFTGCQKAPNVHYKITGISVFNMNDSGSTIVPVGSAGVAGKAYAIKMVYTTQIYGSTAGVVDGTQYLLGDSLSRFNIYSLSDFDATHPALSSLNNLFRCNTFDGDSLPNVLSTGYFFFSPYHCCETDLSAEKDSVNLFLMTPPAVPGIKTFIVDAVFSDNTAYSDTLTVNLY